MSRVFSLVALLPLLAACQGGFVATKEEPWKMIYPITAAAIAVDGVSIINTGKTIDDQVISLATGRDCSIVRASQGGPYCVDIPPPVPMVARTTYCYQSLASASCYDRPSPVDRPNYIGSRIDMIPATN